MMGIIKAACFFPILARRSRKQIKASSSSSTKYSSVAKRSISDEFEPLRVYLKNLRDKYFINENGNTISAEELRKVLSEDCRGEIYSNEDCEKMIREVKCGGGDGRINFSQFLHISMKIESQKENDM
ncbi:hypothetical protein Syun_021495 [Stephania yunnanensis]|uniref:EF-hand domain-containing protein n=1 Tax=Stephania yunnanensis TaxID=152371 RepID=A0AAP0NPT2_9MAGN